MDQNHGAYQNRYLRVTSSLPLFLRSIAHSLAFPGLIAWLVSSQVVMCVTGGIGVTPAIAMLKVGLRSLLRCRKRDNLAFFQLARLSDADFC